MPWGAVSRGAIGATILKQCLKQHGFTTDIHYLNILFAEQIGVDLYLKIANESAFFPEWFFSAALFGKNEMNLISNSLDQLSGADGEQSKGMCWNW